MMVMFIMVLTSLLEACGFEAAEALLLAAPPAKPAVPAPIAAPFYHYDDL